MSPLPTLAMTALRSLCSECRNRNLISSHADKRLRKGEWKVFPHHSGLTDSNNQSYMYLNAPYPLKYKDLQAIANLKTINAYKFNCSLRNISLNIGSLLTDWKVFTPVILTRGNTYFITYSENGLSSHSSIFEDKTIISRCSGGNVTQGLWQSCDL